MQDIRIKITKWEEMWHRDSKGHKRKKCYFVRVSDRAQRPSWSVCYLIRLTKSSKWENDIVLYNYYQIFILASILCHTFWATGSMIFQGQNSLSNLFSEWQVVHYNQVVCWVHSCGKEPSLGSGEQRSYMTCKGTFTLSWFTVILSIRVTI